MTTQEEALEKLVRVFPGSPKLHYNKHYPPAAVVLDFGSPKQRPFCTRSGWKELHKAISDYLEAVFPGKDVHIESDSRGVIFGGVR